MDPVHFIFDAGSCHGNTLLAGSGNHGFRGSRLMLNMEETLKGRRPFFSSNEEIMEEEYYDEQLPEKKRRLTPEQVHLLERSFEDENKLEPERKSELAKKLGLQPRQVAVWFQNRRARSKTKQLERDYDLLRSSYESLVSDYDNLLKENHKLKSEVLSLTERLHIKEVVVNGPDSPQAKPEPTGTVDIGNVKAEDHFSSGSGVVDEDSPQLPDGKDGYFPGEYMGPIDGVGSEEEDGSDDGQSYFSGGFATANMQRPEEAQQLCLWVWS